MRRKGGTAWIRDSLLVPGHALDAVRASALWPPIAGDARASLEALRVLSRHRFDPGRCRDLRIPVLLQLGSESPRHLYVTDAFAAALPDVRVEKLRGQAHEGMTTAPEMYAEAITSFLLGRSSAPRQTAPAVR